MNPIGSKIVIFVIEIDIYPLYCSRISFALFGPYLYLFLWCNSRDHIKIEDKTGFNPNFLDHVFLELTYQE
jgi:hypothetical protein